MDKKTTHADLEISISGTVLVYCDRCLEPFFFPVNWNNRVLVKFGKSIDNNDPDIISVPFEVHELDMKQYFYEFIHLAIPIKRVHPPDENGKSTCDPLMLKKLNELIIDEEPENDPRWDELKKLMNDN
jgi:uncharacterized metal-binding protein YceD (DUF177 family)